jgi:BASS family bile acid:Na+ symporter
MLGEGAIPEWVLSAAVVATVFVIMFDIGLAIVPGEFRWVWQRPGLMARALFAVLVAVPALAIAIARALDLPRAAEIGIVLMAISPGAPVALRRSLGAGAHRSFAPALQIVIAVLAVASMPLSIALLDEFYAGSASVAPWHLAKQVFTVQILPLGLGMLARRLFGLERAQWLAPQLARIGTWLLVAVVLLILYEIWGQVVAAGLRVALAIVIVTLASLAVGDRLGGPDAATRTATAICSAARNGGLALLVATLDAAAPAIKATVLAYVVISAFTLIPYVIWRRRAAP